MKLPLLCSVCLAVLIPSTPAHADPAMGGNSILQSGQNDQIDLMQPGTNDQFQIVQAGDDASIVLRQNGNIGGQAFINQIGARNSASLMQDDDGSGSLAAFGSGFPVAIASFAQNGSDNTADVVQSVTGTNGFAAITSESDIIQNGNFNLAAVSQFDSNQFSEIRQSTDGNTVQVTQGVPGTVSSNYSLVAQLADGTAAAHGNNTVDVVQLGDGGFSDITQYQAGNTAKLRSTGNLGSASTILQITSNNFASVDQATFGGALGNQSTITQDVATAAPQDGPGITDSAGGVHYAGVAEVTQNGWGNTSTIDQTGTLLGAFVNQQGNQNTASITQTGLGNTGTIEQLGNLNGATLEQLGDRNAATISQYGDGYSYSLTQSGNGAVVNITLGTPPGN